VSESFVSVVEAHVSSGKVKLPVFEGTAAKLQRMLASPPESDKPLVELLASDAVMASAVLRLANSSFYGGLAQVKTIQDSLRRLGLDQVTRLALVVTQQQAYRVKSAELAPTVSALWLHALATALGSQWLAQRHGRGIAAGEAFLAGMVHDIGKLLVVRVIDELRSQRADFRPSAALVAEMLSSLHARYGATLARGWNLPEIYVNVIEHHHDAEITKADTLLAIVRLVDHVANGLGFGLGQRAPAQLAATAEAQILALSDVQIAELEIHVEDAVGAARAVVAA
jgi:HD-like signal output (HDOD) protein